MSFKVYHSHTIRGRFFKKDKKYIKAIKWLIQIILGISLVFANETISIEFGEVDYNNQIVPILYDSPDVITGFHIFITGMDIIDVYGGISEANNFFLDQGSTCLRDNDCKDFVKGNYTPASIPIPSGSGVLLYVKYEIGDEFDENIIVGPEICLDITEGFIIGPWIDGASLVYEVTGECIPSPSDCNGNYYGSAALDSCGECSGGNSGHEADSDQDDCGVCFGNNVASSGDTNGDFQLNILDIVMMVTHVIDDSYTFDSCELIVGDVNSDSVVNILDIIVVVETIMYGDLARTDEILIAAPSTLELLQRSNSLGYVTDKPGLIGFELILSHEHDFSIVLNEESFIGDYNTSGNETKIIIVMEGGSELFTTTGKFEIEEMMIGTTNGVLLDVAITIIPDEYTLERAYPNPFNPVTTLSFTIPTQSEVALSIYNIQGREVSTLISGYMDAGYHSVVWNADSYSSGVYFVKMVAGEFVNTQKLMLIK